MNDFDLSGNDDGDSSARYFVEHPALKFAMNRPTAEMHGTPSATDERNTGEERKRK